MNENLCPDCKTWPVDTDVCLRCGKAKPFNSAPTNGVTETMVARAMRAYEAEVDGDVHSPRVPQAAMRAAIEATLREQQPSEGDMARALHWLRQHDAPAEHLSALEEAVAGYVEPRAETVSREQQPAGDGGRHVRVLREMLGHGRFMLDDEEAAALDAAIAALTAAGRGGEGEPVAWLHPDWPDNYTSGYSPVSTYYTRDWKPLYAAAPQQPVGVTDAMVDAAERAYSKALQDPNAMRIALAAALSNQQAAPSVSEAEYQAELAGDPALDGWFPGGARPAPTTPAAPEPAASGEGYIMPFDLPRYDFHKREDAHWAVWTPVPSQFGEWCRYRDVITAPRRFTTGQGDVERLVEALQSLMEAESRGRVMPIGAAWDAAREALRPFQQQDTPEQEGRS